MNLLEQASKLRLARISLVTGFVITIGLTAGLIQAQDVANEILPKLGLKSGELITIYPEKLGKSQLAIKMNGNDYVIDYAFHSIRSNDFRLLVQNENGELVEQTAPTVSTIRGSLRGIEGSAVTGCVSEEGCCAKIELPTGEDYFIEPVNRKLDNPVFAGVHVVYASEDVIGDGLQCGTVTTLAEDEQNFARESNVNSRNGTLYAVQTIIEADFEYFSNFGSSNATNRQMEMLLNIANSQYESQANIRFTVAHCVVRSNSNDPYNSSFSTTFLDEVISEYQGTSIVADVCHVFTGKDLHSLNTDGSRRELSGVARSRIINGVNVPTVCTASGVSISKDRSSNNLHAATLAHELGHNFNLRHCTILPACAGHTMQTPSNGALSFSSASRIALINSRNSLTCLHTFGGSSNGFGLVGNVDSNDDWINANIIPDLDFSASGNNFNMTTEAEEPDLSNAGSTVWCYIMPEESGTLTLDTFGSDFDTQLHVYESVPGGGLGGLSLVDGGADDDTLDPATGSNRQSQVTIDVTAGTRYEIRVGGFRFSSEIGAGSEGNIDLNGSFVPNPVLLGDVNQNGVVSFLDIQPFITILSANDYLAEADMDQNGVVNFLDIAPFIVALAS